MVHGVWRFSLGLQYDIKVRTLANHNFNPKIYSLFLSINHVLQVRRKEDKPIEPPLYGLLPYFTTWIFAPAYLYLNPEILHYHLIPFVFYIGLINAYSVGQIITKHLTKDDKFPMYNVLTLPLALAVLDSTGPYLRLWPSALGSGTYQIAFIFLCVGLGVGVYGSFVVSVSPQTFARELAEVFPFFFSLEENLADRDHQYSTCSMISSPRYAITLTYGV